MHNVPEGSESHFKVVLVSGSFENKLPVARHRMVNKVLEDELKGNAWLTSDIAEEIIFDTPIASRWEAAVRKMGIDPASLSDVAGHA